MIRPEGKGRPTAGAAHAGLAVVRISTWAVLRSVGLRIRRFTLVAAVFIGLIRPDESDTIGNRAAFVDGPNGSVAAIDYGRQYFYLRSAPEVSVVGAFERG